MKKLLLPALIAATGLLTNCSSGDHANSGSQQSERSGSEESARLNAFLDRVFDRMLERKPQTASEIGIEKHNDRWNPLSDKAAQEELNITKANLDSLKGFDTAKLSESALLSYRLFRYNGNLEIESFPYRFHNFPVNTQEGPHTNVPTFLINIHEVKNVKDARDYIARLNGVQPLFDDLLEVMKIREDKKIIPPKFVYPKVLDACRNVIKGAPFQTGGQASPIWEDFTSKLSKLDAPASTRDSLSKAAMDALNKSVKPAYEKLITYMSGLEKKADTVVGAWTYPDGDKFYAMEVRRFTTTNMTPEEVFQFGQREVARIHNEIRGIMKQIGYTGTIQEFFRYMTDPKNPKSFLPNTQAGKQKYLAMATKYIEDMKGRLDELFLTKPKAGIEVMAVEPFREKSAGTAFYEHPSLDGKRPGRFYANLYDMNQSPLYQLEALAFHEGIPGHHMQISIAQEMKDMPMFRRHADFTAYIEGWGLYSELIPKEIGFYKDPYSDFGRLSMELLRAARCVVDPGMHYKKWSRTHAIHYFMNNTAEPPGECVNAIERYITWPGQATAYMVGRNKILDLREKAKKEMGSKFNIREFHDVVLLSGAVPLSVLEENVNNYINQKK